MVLLRFGCLCTFGLEYPMCGSVEDDCMAAPRDQNSEETVAVCERARADNDGDPGIGIALAMAYHRSGDTRRATALARRLLSTKARGDALHLLGRIAIRDESYEEAEILLEEARRLHLLEGRLFEVANDEQALAAAQTERGKFAEAARTLVSCEAHAERTNHRLRLGYCHLQGARVLSRTGFFRGAERKLARARPLLEARRDIAWLLMEDGNLRQEFGHHAQAIAAFRRALSIAEETGVSLMVMSAHLNLAYSLSEAGRIGEAEAELRAVRALDLSHEALAIRFHLAGRIAYQRGEIARASRLLAQASWITDDHEARLDIAVLQARIALGRADHPAAEDAARRARDLADSLRARQPVELRPWVLSRRRAPHELLFTSLVRAGRTFESLVVFDQWHGRALLDTLSRPSASGQPVDVQAAAAHVDSLPVVLDTPFMAAANASSVADSLEAGDLLVLLVAEGELWRLTAIRGELRAADLGPFRDLRPRLDRFLGRPNDRALAEELGALLVPPDLFRETRAPLRAVIDGPLAAIPLAALRRRGRPLVAFRPIVHPPRLSEIRCVPQPSPPGPAVILADTSEDLPASRGAAIRLASGLGSIAVVGDAASAESLFSATPGSLLHVAVHGEVGDTGGLLLFRDRAVPALEIAARELRPRLAVLSACDSARAPDPEQATSLATAFLAAGSPQVLATLRPVSDPGAAELIDLFYAAGGLTDPIRALAEAQTSLADTANPDWPNFAIFGRDNCRPTE